MRAILGSYDSELTAAEHSPQLTRRVREAEDMVQKVHAHSSDMEVSAGWGAGCSRGGGPQAAWARCVPTVSPGLGAAQMPQVGLLRPPEAAAAPLQHMRLRLGRR